MLPPADLALNPVARTYPDVVGPLGTAPPTIYGQCLFIDPVADVAILGEPDEEDLPDESKAFRRFVRQHRTLTVRSVTANALIWLLNLHQDWELGEAQTRLELWTLSIRKASRAATAFGTSGSPILTGEGSVIGLISGGSGQNPVLDRVLPVRLLLHLGYLAPEHRADAAPTASGSNVEGK